jgi:hypothetical protein
MDTVKKNLISIILGVAAIAAVVANFYPMGGKREALKAEATAHAQKAEELKALITKQRKLPVVQPGATDDSPLNGFPTKKVLEEAHKATDQVNKAAEAITTRASTDLNQHQPLVQGALPGQPGDTLPASTFARFYVSMFPPMVQPGAVAAAPAAPTERPAGSPPSLMDLLHAGTPPSDVDLNNARADKQKQIESETTRYNSSGTVTNPAEVTQAITDAFKTLADDMRTAAAKKCKVWVDPAAFAMYPNLTVQSTPDPSSIFWAQIGLWSQEDLCKAIYSVNASATNVMDAPIKMLVKIDFVNVNQPNSQSSVGFVPVFVIPNLQSATGVGANGAPPMPTAAPDQAAPAPMDPNAAIEKKTVYSPTGRVSNGLFDVTLFDLELICDASKVPQVLDGVEAGQYICVTQVQSIDTVDSAFYRGAGFYFGDKPCVKLKLRCEQLYFRSWLQNFVPTALKPVLQYAAPPPPAAPAT